MKYVACLLLVLAVSIYGEIDKAFIDAFVKRVHQTSVKCVIESRANSKDITEILKKKPPSRREGKCLIFCFNKFFNIQNEDGTINKEGAMQFLEPLKTADADIYKMFLDVYKICQDKTEIESDPCLYAGSLSQCAIVEGKSSGLEAKLLAIVGNDTIFM